VATLLAAAVALPPTLALGTRYCENINNQTVIVGEARYFTLGGSDVCYANAYWDGGDELSLGGDVGGASTAASNLGFKATTHTLDDTTEDCSVVTYSLSHRRSNTTSGSNCPSSYISNTDTLVANSCEIGTSNFLVIDKTFGREGLAYRNYWQWELDVDTGTGCTSSDSGCAEVRDSTSCTLKQF
jgi:hypothetical protein